MLDTTFCICRSEPQAEQVLNGLRKAGFKPDQISILVPKKPQPSDAVQTPDNTAPEAAGTGAGAGALLGGAAGWLIGVTSFVIPGIGPFFAAGPLIAGIEGLAVGGILGGLISAMRGEGVSQDEIKDYERRLKEGNILIVVHPANQHEIEEASKVFRRAGAEEV